MQKIIDIPYFYKVEVGSKYRDTFYVKDNYQLKIEKIENKELITQICTMNAKEIDEKSGFKIVPNYDSSSQKLNYILYNGRIYKNKIITKKEIKIITENKIDNIKQFDDILKEEDNDEFSIFRKIFNLTVEKKDFQYYLNKFFKNNDLSNISFLDSIDDIVKDKRLSISNDQKNVLEFFKKIENQYIYINDCLYKKLESNYVKLQLWQSEEEDKFGIYISDSPFYSNINDYLLKDFNYLCDIIAEKKGKDFIDIESLKEAFVLQNNLDEIEGFKLYINRCILLDTLFEMTNAINYNYLSKMDPENGKNYLEIINIFQQYYLNNLPEYRTQNQYELNIDKFSLNDAYYTMLKKQGKKTEHISYEMTNMKEIDDLITKAFPFIENFVSFVESDINLKEILSYKYEKFKIAVDRFKFSNIDFDFSNNFNQKNIF